MKTDIVPLLDAVVDGDLAGHSLDWREGASVCVVLVSRGYPGDYKRDIELKGLEVAESMENVFLFHSGTVFNDSKIVTNGGRVLGVTAVGKTFEQTIDLAYSAVDKIDTEGLHYRTDIGRKALNHM